MLTVVRNSAGLRKRLFNLERVLLEPDRLSKTKGIKREERSFCLVEGGGGGKFKGGERGVQKEVVNLF